MGFVYLQEIAEYLATDNNADYMATYSRQNEMYQALRTAALKGELAVYKPKTKIKYIPEAHENTIFTTEAAVNLWLKSIDAPYHYGQTEVAGDIGTGNHAGTEPKPEALSKLQKQQAAILKVIEAKRFKPMAIPDNEKGTIKLICESDNPVLFEAETAFDRAWKLGIGKLWQMENHESYARRGNN